MTTPGLRPTPLVALHRELGARLVPYAGYELPVQYPSGIKAEHLATRTRATLFDVSHMGQVAIDGPVELLESLVVGDLAALAVGAQRYTLLTNEAGGIVDDLMTLRLPGHWLFVVNAAHKYEVVAAMRAALGAGVRVELLEDRALLAVQGPQAAAVLAPHCAAAGELAFMHGAEMDVAGIPCLVTRSGYTGEDGFEIACPAGAAEELARRLLADPALTPAGLGARDSLRLEAGLPLAGADIDATMTPVTAALGWTVARKYRDGSAQPGFPGAARILAEFTTPPAQRRVGLRPQGRVPVRAGAELQSAAGVAVGRVTSGGYGASVDAPIAMGYVARDCAAVGTRLAATVRERHEAVEIAALPFVPHRYHKS